MLKQFLPSLAEGIVGSGVVVGGWVGAGVGMGTAQGEESRNEDTLIVKQSLR